MDEKNIILEDCPCCRGNGLIVHEGGWNAQTAVPTPYTLTMKTRTTKTKPVAVLSGFGIWVRLLSRISANKYIPRFSGGFPLSP